MSSPQLRYQPSLAGRYWLLFSLLLTLLPHLSRLPVWLAVAALTVLGWRLLRDQRDWPLPGKLLRTLATLFAIGAILLVFRTILGREAGSALLSVLICLKLLELRTLRDAMMVVFLGYFLVAADFLFDESIFTGLYMFAVVLSLTATLIALNHPAATAARTPFYLKRAAVLLGQALPLMLLLFILFPRINSPLWRIPEQNSLARTGLSEEMRPGDITNLVESDELVFRVEFTDAIPSADQLYWRGPVLWLTDGRGWFKLSPQEQRTISRHAPGYQPLGATIHYTIVLEPQQNQWLFALDLPASPPTLEGGAMLLPDFQMVANTRLIQRVRYTMTSVPHYRTGQLQPEERALALQLPSEANPQTVALAHMWRSAIGDDAALVEHALDYLRTQSFYYTRQPPPLGSDAIDHFLFTTRQGFCEHYASAFVTLMRAAQIPARVVTGYQGGDLNGLGKFLEVRQNRAHAWTEVWLPGEGWVRVDPTAAIPSERVMEPLDTLRFQTTASAPTTVVDSTLLRSTLLQLQQGWSAMNYAWSVWVIGFNVERQQALFKKWGIETFNLRLLLALLFISVGIVFAIITLLVLPWHARSSDPVRKHYLIFLRRLARVGMETPLHVGPLQVAERARAVLPQHAALIDAIINLYVALRYGGGDTGRLSEFKALVKQFRP